MSNEEVDFRILKAYLRQAGISANRLQRPDIAGGMSAQTRTCCKNSTKTNLHNLFLFNNIKITNKNTPKVIYNLKYISYICTDLTICTV